FYGVLKDKVTVHSAGGKKKTSRNWRVTRTRSTKININAATPQMLLSLPMMTQELVDAVLAARQTAEIESVSELVEIVGMDAYTAMRSYITLYGTAFYTIRSTGMPQKGLTRKDIEVVVEIDGSYSRGYRIIEWKEDMAAFEEGQGKTGAQG
ncbi:MAG: hypothetical protein JRF65_05610, partial [Deltaproteobacteria bacterium]|nr:hypothetical protein [Deltaproteobacteria bacterium]